VAARSKARKRALDILFEAELRGISVLDLLAERIRIGDPPVSEYAAGLVRGVMAHRDRIDELISTHAEGWTLERMPAVDRNTLRIGAYELIWADDIPDGVALSEAVQLATDLSTDASPAFINGLLARLATLKPTLITPAPDASDASDASDAPDADADAPDAPDADAPDADAPDAPDAAAPAAAPAAAAATAEPGRSAP
jgi:transcription antitermination protein NusB